MTVISILIFYINYVWLGKSERYYVTKNNAIPCRCTPNSIDGYERVLLSDLFITFINKKKKSRLHFTNAYKYCMYNIYISSSSHLKNSQRYSYLLSLFCFLFNFLSLSLFFFFLSFFLSFFILSAPFLLHACVISITLYNSSSISQNQIFFK